MPKPPPFTRPSVDLGPTNARSWRIVTAADLAPGDIVAGHGLLTAVETVPGDDRLTLIFPVKTMVFAPDEPLQAFVPTDG